MRRWTTLIVLICASFVLAAWPPVLYGQPQTDQKSLSFEVATIKRNRSVDDFSEGGFQPGGRVNARNVSFFGLMVAAYATGKIDGGPAWTKTDRFDVVAVGNRNASVAETRQMLRTLLADRFKLVTRRDSREEPTFDLTLVRQDRQLGSQLQPATTECSEATRSDNLPPATTAPNLEHPAWGVIALVAVYTEVTASRSIGSPHRSQVRPSVR